MHKVALSCLVWVWCVHAWLLNGIRTYNHNSIPMHIMYNTSAFCLNSYVVVKQIVIFGSQLVACLTFKYSNNCWKGGRNKSDNQKATMTVLCCSCRDSAGNEECI